MSSTQSQPKSDPVRYLLVYRRRVSNTQVLTDTQIIEEFAKRQNLDSQHIIHLGTSKTDRRVHIVFDYNNPDHGRCLISAFRGRHPKAFKLDKSQADYVHSRVDGWKASILAAKAHNAQFPVRTEVYSPDRKAHLPSSGTNSITHTATSSSTQASPASESNIGREQNHGNPEEAKENVGFGREATEMEEIQDR